MSIEQYCIKHQLKLEVVNLLIYAVNEGQNTINFLLSLDTIEDNNFENYLKFVIGEYDNEWKLKKEIVDLLKKDKSKTALFDKFIDLLNKAKVLTNGYVDNKQEYSVILMNQSTEQAFYGLMDKLDVELEKLVKVTVAYYKEGSYRKKLDGYLREIALIDYKNFKDEPIVYKGLK